MRTAKRDGELVADLLCEPARLCKNAGGAGRRARGRRRGRAVSQRTADHRHRRERGLPAAPSHYRPWFAAVKELQREQDLAGLAPERGFVAAEPVKGAA